MPSGQGLPGLLMEPALFESTSDDDWHPSTPVHTPHCHPNGIDRATPTLQCDVAIPTGNSPCSGFFPLKRPFTNRTGHMIASWQRLLVDRQPINSLKAGFTILSRFQLISSFCSIYFNWFLNNKYYILIINTFWISTTLLEIFVNSQNFYFTHSEKSFFD